MKKAVAIIGSGPSALMLSAKLDGHLFDVTVYEKNQATARKFLVAGQGGFNLTHSEPLAEFVRKYTPTALFEPLLAEFSNQDLIDWLHSIGIQTFEGSSKRIFPEKEIKPIQVLNAILTVVKSKKVTFQMKQTWLGWDKDMGLIFDCEGQRHLVKADIVVFALGGSSWKITGSDGLWSKAFEEKGINVQPFAPSNSAVKIDWPASFLALTEGKALKNIEISCLGKRKKGEVVITKFGLEGGVVYALSPEIREQIKKTGKANLEIDLKPEFSLTEIHRKLSNSRGTKSWTKHLQDQLRFDEIKMALLKNVLDKEVFMDPMRLSTCIKAFPLNIVHVAPLDEAISTAGGISLDEIDNKFQLRKLPGHYAIGEMLDWDAPTGGYLLQGCFTMGAVLANHLNSISPLVPAV
ncbi:MAG TPA: TIGR03862 family flavoprotein [Bacteroidia bacterium]|jgi:hypothetical protein|nr:TIGR03862 family flavoprotein [Bacteroidia bacterium]